MEFKIFNFLLETERIISREEILRILQQVQDIEGIISIQSFNHSNIISSLHIKSAVWHAIQGYLSKKMISNQLSVDILLYLSCQRQIRKALEKLGIPKEVMKLGLIIVSEKTTKTSQSIINLLKIKFNEYSPTIRPFEKEKSLENIEELTSLYDIQLNTKNSNINLIEKQILAKIALLRMNSY